MFSSWGTMGSMFVILGIYSVTLVTCQISFNNRPNPHRGGGIEFPLPAAQSPRPVRPTHSQTEPSGCNCIAASNCPKGFGQFKLKCLTEQGGAGICCIPQKGVLSTRIGFSGQESIAPMKLSTKALNDGVIGGKAAFQKMKQNEETRIRNRQFLARGTPARGHAYFFQRRNSAKVEHAMAYQIAQTSIEIAKAQSLSPEQSFFELQKIKFQDITPGLKCPAMEIPRCNPRAEFRTIDGTCNNLRNPNFGKSDTVFGRLTEPLYNDGIMEPRLFGIDKFPLPNARDASNNILLDLDIPDTQFTLNVMQWSQFVDHDLTHAPFMDMNGEAIMCCENGRVVNPQPEGCFNILIPASDRFFGRRRQRCINFVRSMLATNADCSMGPVEQLNSLTHWLDGSMIYGSTDEEKRSIVDERTGFMKTSQNDLPPIDENRDCEARIRNTPCFVAGDSRVTEQPALTATHTVWIREHNRIAKALIRLNPRLTPEELFEKTRRIVVAEVQHITFKEWLPIIIGESTMRQFGINTLTRGFRNNYDPSINPAMFNEFATAAFRFGHSLVQGLFKLISDTGRLSTLRLRDTFNAPDLLMRDPKLVDDFVRSLTTQRIQTMDSFITQDLSNHLFQTPRFDFGMDLMSLNIQRGREHAIGTYNQLREVFGLPVARSFLDLLDTTPRSQVIRMQTVYRNVEDIDLFVGGITEKHLPDALLGRIFATIIGRQFQMLMNGDRFFYDLGGQPGSFTLDQLQEIRKTSMSKVFCETTQIGKIQPASFFTPNSRNQVTPCEQIPGIDLSLFV